MGDVVIRLRNVLGMCKIETTEGVDPTPAAATDAFPFEIDSLSIGSPFTTEQSGEATGTMIAGAPLIIGQAVPVSIRCRMKGAGAGAVYSASVKPPAHALLASCGWRGVFTAAVAATALSAGTTTSGTLATPYAGTAQLYRGMPLLLGGTGFPGARPLVTDYTAGRVATLADVFGSALTAAATAELKPNWTYAMTSPVSDAERAADQPSATLYFNEDGINYKLLAFRGALTINAQTARPGFFEISGMAIWGGQADVAIPTGAVVASHAAPMLNMQTGISPAFAVDRKMLPISNFSYATNAQVDSYEDPNTINGFGAAQLGGREGTLTCDPLKTRLSVRDHLAALPDGGPYVGAVRAGQAVGNRWTLTLPQMLPAGVEMSTRGNARSENLTLRAMSPGRDNAGRDGDAILCFD